MTRCFLTMVALLLYGLLLQAQTPAPKPARWQYAALVGGGAVVGANGESWTAQTVQGLRRGNWMAGIGIAADAYRVPAFPLSLYGQYAHGAQKAKPIAYAQAGPSFPWARGHWNDKFDGGQPMYKMETGWMAEAGLGLRLPVGKTHGLQLSAGYSIRRNGYHEAQVWFSPWPIMPGSFSYIHREVTMRRLVVKLQFAF